MKATNLLDDPRLDWKLLEENGFDRERFLRCASAIAEGRMTARSSVLSDSKIEPVEDVVPIEWGDAGEPAAWREAGEAALAAGKVAVVVLNGGMATRFGNVVKGTVEVFDGESFLTLKAKDVAMARKRWGAPVPLVLMNSFATESATRAHVAERNNLGLPQDDLLTFRQSISIRLSPDASLFIGADGKPSYHAPGHGDFFACIRGSGVLSRLRERGVEVVLFSNVDNLGATVDPTVVGQHVVSGADMTAEVTAKRRTASGEWDKGGAPARVDGRRQIVEGFRLPADLPPTFLPDFSTNNFIFRLAAIDRDIPLERHVVEKKVDGRPAIQLESITCEASAIYDGGAPLLRLNLVRVPRDGDRGRFFPVKERIDLDAMRDVLKGRLEAGWR